MKSDTSEKNAFYEAAAKVRILERKIAQEEMDWFIYEWDSEGANQIEVEGKEYTINSPEDFWNYLVDVYK